MGSPLSNGILIPTNITGNEERLRNEQRLQHSGRIPYFTFQYLSVGSSAIAVLAAAARIIVRIHIRRFGLDDCFVLLAIICLSGATGIMLKYTRELFFVEALTQNRAYILTSEDVKSFGSVLRIASCFPALSWTATIAVKLSFLVLFRQLIKRVSKRITIYIWVVITITALLWIFAWSGTLIACLLNGPEHCMTIFTDKRSFVMDVTIVSLDMATDVMIVIIPVLILRISQMKLTQKLGLAALLCLSVFTVLICAIRIAGSAHRHDHLDSTWSWFWMHIESCVATIMVSISAFSPFLFINRDRMKKADEKKQQSKVPSPLNQERVLQNNKSLGRSGWGNMGREGLPAPPLATLTRIHRFIYDDSRLTEGTETIESINHSADEERQPYVLSAGTEGIQSKVRSYSRIAPA